MAVRLCYVAELCGRPPPFVHCPERDVSGRIRGRLQGFRGNGRRRDTRETARLQIEICGGAHGTGVCAPGLWRLMYASGRRYETATCLHKQVRHGPLRIVSYGIVKVGYRA